MKHGKKAIHLLWIIPSLAISVAVASLVILTLKLREEFFPGKWVTICSTKTEIQGERAYGSVYFSDEDKCDHADWPNIKVWVKVEKDMKIEQSQQESPTSDVNPQTTTTPKSLQTAKLTPSDKPTPIASPLATATPTKSTITNEELIAPKIISISDNLGNMFEMNCSWSSTHYECYPKSDNQPSVSVKSAPQITFTINASDPNNRTISYRFSYANGCGWIGDKSCTSVLDPNALGVTTFIFNIKNDDNYASVGLDANTALHYRLTE